MVLKTKRTCSPWKEGSMEKSVFYPRSTSMELQSQSLTRPGIIHFTRNEIYMRQTSTFTVSVTLLAFSSNLQFLGMSPQVAPRSLLSDISKRVLVTQVLTVSRAVVKEEGILAVAGNEGSSGALFCISSASCAILRRVGAQTSWPKKIA
jgi:hypothetical protein